MNLDLNHMNKLTHRGRLAVVNRGLIRSYAYTISQQGVLQPGDAVTKDFFTTDNPWWDSAYWLRRTFALVEDLCGANAVRSSDLIKLKGSFENFKDQFDAVYEFAEGHNLHTTHQAMFALMRAGLALNSAAFNLKDEGWFQEYMTEACSYILRMIAFFGQNAEEVVVSRMMADMIRAPGSALRPKRLGFYCGDIVGNPTSGFDFGAIW